MYHSFVANDASFGTSAFNLSDLSDVILLGLPMYRCLQQILFLFYQPSVELELWMQFHVFKKVRNISRFDTDSHECATIICHALRKVNTLNYVLLKFA